jgi:hypothetical protein
MHASAEIIVTMDLWLNITSRITYFLLYSSFTVKYVYRDSHPISFFIFAVSCMNHISIQQFQENNTVRVSITDNGD